MFTRYLARLLCKDCVFPLPGPEDDRFHAAGAQRDLIIPLSALLVHPASSPYLDTNVGIGLRATESLIGLLDITTMSNESDVGMGTVRAIGGEGLSESR